MAFIHENFLLQSETAIALYHQFAAPQPVLDYHCHLPVQDIAQNRHFNNLFEIWLEGDHYKWKAMRTTGLPERFSTGDATPYEKFFAWAQTVPKTLRNPLYHWTHLELARYFDITELLDEHSAPRIWNQANEVLSTGALDVHPILNKFAVKLVGTTDDPADSLHHHAQLAASNLPTRVLPTFRPDKALRVHSPAEFNLWVNRLAQASDHVIDSLPTFLIALTRRVEDFHNLGCRLSDHGLDICYSDPATSSEAAAIFDAARSGVPASPEDHYRFASYILMHLAQLYAQHDWTMQLHLGAQRNVNSRAMKHHGPDTGFDTMGTIPQIPALVKFLDTLEIENTLPRTILYNNNPAENYPFAALAGVFSAPTIPGKVQFGSGWWFLDQKEGIEWQLNALSSAGLLSQFVGMVTDSRSFMSYPRHEYFRRILCNLLGTEMEQGLIPNDQQLIGHMVSNICYHNAQHYFAFAQKSSPKPAEYAAT